MVYAAIPGFPQCVPSRFAASPQNFPNFNEAEALRPRKTPLSKVCVWRRESGCFASTSEFYPRQSRNGNEVNAPVQKIPYF